MPKATQLSSWRKIHLLSISPGRSLSRGPRQELQPSAGLRSSDLREKGGNGAPRPRDGSCTIILMRRATTTPGRPTMAHAGKQRMCGGRTAGLGNAHADSDHEELREARGRAAQRAQDRPDGERDGDDIHAADAFGQPRNGNSAEGVKQREGRTTQQPQLRVRHREIQFQRLTNNGNDATVHRVECVGHGEQQHDNTLVRSRVGGRFHSALCC